MSTTEVEAREKSARKADRRKWVAGIFNRQKRYIDVALSLAFPPATNEANGAASFLRSEEDCRAIVAVVYLAFLDRSPDQAGLRAYVDALSNGLSVASLIAEFANSDEARERGGDSPFLIPATERNGKTDDLAMFVRLAYHCLLNREPDPEEVRDWRTALEQDLSVFQFAFNLATCAEARRWRTAGRGGAQGNLTGGQTVDDAELRLVVDLTYEHFFGRAPDAEGGSIYVEALKGGMPISELISEIRKSPERSQRAPTWTEPETTLAGSPLGNEDNIRMVIGLVYASFLEREPDPDGLRIYTGALQNGLPLGAFVADIASSAEAGERLMGRPFAVSVAEQNARVNDVGVFIRLAYYCLLGREPERDEAAEWRTALEHGLPAFQFVFNLATCVETNRRRRGGGRNLGNGELSLVVDLAYKHFLGRPPDAEGAFAYLEALKDGLPISELIRALKDSPERSYQEAVSSPLATLSDGEFILEIAELLFEGTGARPMDIEAYKQFLQEKPERRPIIVNRLLSEHHSRLQRQTSSEHDPHNCWIMGTREFLTPELWKARSREIAHDGKGAASVRRPKLTKASFDHSGEYVVSAICSMYKGRKYIEGFLENISSQSYFDRSELIIIDADSPDGEDGIIFDYQKRFPNIVYRRMNYRIGIYDAWNEGVRLARGRYLTNTNLDDLRRCDSFELQAQTLDSFEFADVAYQDFYYSFDSSLDFAEAEEFGFKSNLPIVTANNLICFNSPHNAPMWRARLHAEVGLFDTHFRSAGDHEFWLRCMANGKQFIKINTPHVVYFQNPEGISTSPGSRGVQEGRSLWKKYARKLTSPYLSMSRRDFAAALGVTDDWPWGELSYDVVQGELAKLSDRFRGP